jgi:hypothetical protein
LPILSMACPQNPPVKFTQISVFINRTTFPMFQIRQTAPPAVTLIQSTTYNRKRWLLNTN